MSQVKCKFYDGDSSRSKLRYIANMNGFVERYTPFNYFEVSIFKRNPRTRRL